MLRCQLPARITSYNVCYTKLLRASFSPKAVRFGRPVQVNVAGVEGSPVTVVPTKETALGWREPTWEEALPEKRAMFGAEVEDDR